MYRLLAAEDLSGERRKQRAHTAYTKPELLAVRPREVWSWDITKIKGPAKWTCFHLYVILDIFSRYVVGWMIAARESAELAEQFIADTVHKERIPPETLTLHADRGTSMRSKPVAALLVDLDVIKTHSRPHVSDDNPYSEAQFKTLKYRPDFPARFASIEHARAHCQVFFRWYNTVHRHSGIAMMTPHTVHHGHHRQLTDDIVDRCFDYEKLTVGNIVVMDPDNKRVWLFQQGNIQLLTGDTVRLMLSRQAIDFPFAQLFAELDEANE